MAVEFPDTWGPEGGRIPKPLIFAALGYKPRIEAALRFHRSQAKVREIIAPARTSKSYATAKDVFAGVLPDFRVEGKSGRLVPLGESKLSWIIGLDYDTNKEFFYLYEDFVERRSFHHLEYELESHAFRPKQGHMHITLNWGNGPDGFPVKTYIEGKTANRPETLQGEEIHYWVQSEAAEHPDYIYPRYGETRAAHVIFPTTPKLKAKWLKEMWEKGESVWHLPECAGPVCAPRCPVVELGIECFEFTPHANPTYKWRNFWQAHMQAESRVLGRMPTRPDDLDAPCSELNGHDCFDPSTECAAMQDHWFGEQFGGKWTGEGDRLLPFHTFGASSNVLHYAPQWLAFAKRYVSFDYGRTDPCVILWWAVGTDGVKVAYREVYETGMNPEAAARRAKAITEDYGERVEFYIPDPQKPEVEDYLRQLGLPVMVPDHKAMTDRKASSMRVIDELSTDPGIGTPRLFFMDEGAGHGYGCPRSIKELENLRRKKGSDHLDEFAIGALQGADHAFDCTRYFVASQPKPGQIDLRDANDIVDEHIAKVRRMHRMRRSAGFGEDLSMPGLVTRTGW